MAVVFKFPNEKSFADSDLNQLLKVQTVKGFSLGNIFLTALFACLSHIFIDIRFEPYGFAFYPTSVKYYLAVGYGVIMGGGFYLGHILMPGKAVFWPVWKELLWGISVVIIITVLNYLYRSFGLTYIFQMNHIYEVSFFRFLLVGFEVAGSTALVLKFFQTVLIKSDMIKTVAGSAGSEFIHDSVKPGKGQKDEMICVRGQNKEETFCSTQKNFMYVFAKGNYVEIYMKNPDSDVMHKKMLRQSLSNIEEQLKKHDDILRVHKSYLINKNQIQKVKGNSKKASVVLNDLTEIPIRRELYKPFRQIFPD
ncbi:MAG: LytR/AlgR family response regulator transcription factor [Bacteroidota bacterium]